MFYISRLLVELLAPFNLSLLLLFISLVFLLLQRRRTGIFLLVAGLTIQLACGYGFIARSRIIEKELQYPALSHDRLAELQHVKLSSIVVLGSGHVSDPRLPATSQIGGSSLYRLVEGIRLGYIFPQSKLIVSGGKGYDPVPNAEVVTRVARSLGFPEDRIVVENRPRDTLQEAEMLSAMLGKSPFLLVTSALHMPRAMEVFQAHGLHPIAAPTDFIVKQHIITPAGDIFPSTGNLELSKRMIYEWIGTVWKMIKSSTEKYQ